MSLIVHPSLLQGSEEWLEQRRGMVTASVVGQLITPSTVKPASNDYSRALTALLVAERITDWTDPVYVNDDMLRGHEDEPRAVEKYEEWRKVTVDKVGFMIREFTVDGRTFRIGYSPDGLVGTDGLVEVKSPRAKTHLRTILSGEVPPNHMAQLQCGLLVSGRKWIDFISYCGGMPMWCKRVEPDPRWHEAIVAAVTKFEETAADMVADYHASTEGLPATERVVEMEMVI
jgi:hypothetical protein